MAFLKFANAGLIEARIARSGAPLMRTAHRAVFEYEPRPGFLYVRSRAISSRTNDNWDTFPAEEIEKGWRTFIGKPVFVNHHNDDHRRARGVIIDAVLHKDTALDGSPDVWVEVLQEVDALRFPKLAQAIINGDIERTSMGCDVAFSKCSYCDNVAATPLEYCSHIPRLKGKRIRRKASTGQMEDVLVHEICSGLSFFENSLLVEDPADPTAFFTGVDTRGLQMAASKTAADYGRPAGNATEVQEHKPPIKGKLIRGFNVGVGWGSLINRTGDQRVVVPAGTEGDIDLTWRDSSGVLRCRITFDSKHVQGNAYEGGAAEATIVVDERFVDLMGRKITAPAAPGRDPKAPCPLSGQPLRGYGYNDYNVICPECGAYVKRTKQGYGNHKPGPQLDASTCSGVGQSPVKHDNRWGCPSCDFVDRGMTSHDQIPKHKPVKGSTIGGLVHEQTKLGYGEVKAPAQIDTLRVRECPVCSEEDSWDGDGRCRVCGYLPPPEPFRDPDLSVAQKADMREGPVNPDVFKAPPFIPPHEEEVDEEEDDPLDPAAPPTEFSMTFKSTLDPVTAHLSPIKEQNAEGASMRPTLATATAQKGIIDRQASLIGRQRAYIARLERKLADIDNPGNPVAEPSSDSPSQGTSNEDVRSADVDTEVTTPGGVMPVGEPMAKTDPTQPGSAASTDALLVSNEAPTETTDVTAPVGNAGEQQPLADTKTEITPDTGGEAIGPNFLGPDEWANKAASIAQRAQAHTFAALRLAKLRIAAGLVRGDELEVASKIASTVSLADIRKECTTLTAVARTAQRKSASAPRRAEATRSTPSFVSAAGPVQVLGSRPSMDVADDEIGIFGLD